MADTKTQPSTNDLSTKEISAAQKDGVKKAITDHVADGFAAIDGDLPGEAPSTQYLNSDEIQPWAHNLELGVDAFEKLVAVTPGKENRNRNEGSIPDEKVYGLLALERNGQNRTPYVQAMMKRLKLKGDELPGGGPSYTNDMTAISDLD
jgi:hypothetical protein